MIEATGPVVDAMREQLAAQRPLRLRPQGYSMWPAIKPGRIVVVVPSNTRDIDVGDIVLFHVEATLVLHRVVARHVDAFLTKGDATASHDGWIPRAHILGRLSRRRWDPALAWLSTRGGAPLSRLIHGVRRRLPVR
ncbi:MAG: signal peptidase I [Myxococcota bacterium]|jgi:signal peptidase I